MRDAERARLCGMGMVLELPNVTPGDTMQPGATAPAFWKNEPPVSTPVDAGLRQVTPANANERRGAVWKNEPTAKNSAVISGRKRI